MVESTKTGHLKSMAPFFIFAAVLFIVGLIITLFIRTPKDNEIAATKAELEESKKATAKARAANFEGWTSKEVMKMPGFLIIGIGLASLNEDYAAFLDTKLSFGTVGIIGMMYGIGCLIGNVTGGNLFDN